MKKWPVSKKSNHLQNNEPVEHILGFNNNLLIRDLFRIMNEVLANRDISTYKHTVRVAQIAMTLGIKMDLADEELAVLELSCLIHDIGKTTFRDYMVLKPDLFNDQDRRITEYHPLIRAKIFASRLHVG